jgi:hypothetical protein
MWQGGWEVHYVPGATITHRYERNSARRAFSPAWRWHVASMLRFYAKHYLRPAGLVEAWTGPRLGAAPAARQRRAAAAGS